MNSPFLRRNAIYLAWVVSLFGLSTCVFYGEILGNPPCPLCWYQRTFLFPLVILLGIGAYRNDSNVVIYALPLAFLGVFFAVFHVLQPYIPLLQRANICKMGIPCTHSGFAVFFPFFSAIGFFLIAWLLLIHRKK